MPRPLPHTARSRHVPGTGLRLGRTRWKEGLSSSSTHPLPLPPPEWGVARRPSSLASASRPSRRLVGPRPHSHPLGRSHSRPRPGAGGRRRPTLTTGDSGPADPRASGRLARARAAVPPACRRVGAPGRLGPASLGPPSQASEAERRPFDLLRLSLPFSFLSLTLCPSLSLSLSSLSTFCLCNVCLTVVQTRTCDPETHELPSPTTVTTHMHTL